MLSSPIDGRIFGEDQPCFGCGPSHPFGFRLQFHIEDGEVVTHFTPGPHMQGVPTMMHGGLVATLADEIGGYTVIALRGKFAFTGSMNCRFPRPVRVGRSVEGRGRIVTDGSRVVKVAVRLLQDGVECFTSDMSFVILDQEGAERMIGGPMPESWKRFAR